MVSTAYRDDVPSNLQWRIHYATNRKPRDVLVIGLGNSTFHATLGGISSAVLTKYGKTVWKEITGPEDSLGYTNCWLGVETPDLNEDKLQVGFCYDFQIAKYTLFTCVGGDFSYGVIIKVHKLSLWSTVWINFTETVKLKGLHDWWQDEVKY